MSSLRYMELLNTEPIKYEPSNIVKFILKNKKESIIYHK